MSVVVVSAIAGTSDADITGVTAGTGATGGGTSGTVTIGVDVGTTANKIVQLDSSAKLPAVDGSQLTNLSLAVVASSIVDSDTTHAPDGNSVFDALALKAGVTLNNLTSPTAINQDLILATGSNATLKTVNSSSASKNLTLISGTSSAGASGTISLFSGVGATLTGDVLIGSGTPSATNIDSGSITLSTGETTGTGISGNVTIATGQTVNGNTGNIVLSMTAPGGGGAAGHIQFLDGSEGTTGHIWTSIDTSGKGHWASTIPTLLTKTSNYTITNIDGTIVADSSGGVFNLTLPDPSTVIGRIYRIIDKAGTFNTNNVTLVRFGSEKISGIAASRSLQANWGFYTITSDGTDWYLG